MSGYRSNTSLYVGNLSPDVTEEMLHQTFEKAFEIGGAQGQQPPQQHVVSIKICRDAITRRSLGYGYVNFLDPKDAEKALDVLNYIPIGPSKRPCHIMWSQRDPSLRRSGVGNVFVKNLDPSIDSKTLHDTFSQFGNILSCKVMTDEKGVSKGFGFVHFETEEDASKAIEMSGNILQNKPITVTAHIPKKEFYQKVEEYKKNFVNVYVKNVAENVTDEAFKQKFAEYGAITSAKVMREPNGKSKGFGFVNYEQHTQAQQAVEALNGTNFENKILYVARAQKKREREEEKRRNRENRKRELVSRSQNVNLYIKNIDETVTEAKLKEIFSPYGTITSCKIMTDEKGNSKGFGFVCFSSPEESNKALNEMNGKMIVNKPLYVAVHQPKEIRRQQLENQHFQRNSMRPMMNYPFYPYPPNSYGFRAPRYGGFNPGYPGRAYPNQGQQPTAINRGAPRQPQQQSQQRPRQQQTQPRPGTQIPMGIPNKPMQQPGMKPEYKFARGVKNTPQEQQQPIDMSKLGDSLYFQIQKITPEYAPKITGMLLEMPGEEVNFLLNNPAALQEKVNEALALLGSQ